MAASDEAFGTVSNKKAKSELWKHFGLKFDTKSNKIVEGIAVCKLCNVLVKNSGGTTNLRTHIDRHHPVHASKLKSAKCAESSQVEPELYYPLLAELVKCRLCIPATSVPSERIFSTAGDL